ncbi:MAG TPA: hypothetical protein VIL07_01640 [Symbiobacteriaceae bacterium]
MALSWRSQRGSTSLEAVLHLPLLLLLLLGGLLVALSLLIKAALIFHVFQQTEEAAIRPPIVAGVSEMVELVRSDPPPGLAPVRYHGFRLALPLPSQPFAVSAACYSLPLGMPRLSGIVPDAAALPAVENPPGTYLEQIIQAVRRTEYAMAQAGQLVADTEDLVDHVDLARQVVSQAASSRESARRQAVRLLSSWALDAGLRQTCRQDGPWVITARAVALSEQTKGLR